MNLRCDDTFVEDEGWHRAAERYSSFLRTREGQKILFLELGVGFNTPVIIKYPFWRMTAKNPKAVYACVNLGQAYCPAEIGKRGIALDADSARDSFPAHRVNGALPERRQTSAPGSLHTQKHLCLHFADRGVFDRIQVFHVGFSVPQASRLRGRSGICGHFSVTTVTPFSPSP